MKVLRLNIKETKWLTIQQNILKPIWVKKLFLKFIYFKAPHLDIEQWKIALKYAKTRRLSNIFLAELYCINLKILFNFHLGLYGSEKELLTQISCSCKNGDEKCQQDLVSFSGNTIGYFRYKYVYYF